MNVPGAISLTLLAMLMACSGPSTEQDTVAEQPKQNRLDLTAENMRFSGPNTVKSGWTTISMNNLDGMLHFAMVVKLPEGVSAIDYSDEVGTRFQQGYDFMMAGDFENVGATFGSMPAWVGQLSWHGGPGFASAGVTSEATMWLEPGSYLLECYIKSNGIFHSASPDKGVLTMIHPFTVSDAPGGMTEPSSNITVTIAETGLSISEGAFEVGTNSVRVNFNSQVRLPSFVGQDVHIARLESDGDAAAVLGYMDWQKAGGLSIPAPVTFVGGINDVMPAGSTAWFTTDLTPGSYALIGEVPDPASKGMWLEFEIK